MIWKTIPGFSRYEASDRGHIRNASTGFVLSQHAGNKNHRTCYLRLCLVDDEGRERNRNVHVLVCTTFHGPRPPDKPEVRHLNGKSLDNRARNLRWGTRAQNIADIARHKARRQA